MWQLYRFMIFSTSAVPSKILTVYKKSNASLFTDPVSKPGYGRSMAVPIEKIRTIEKKFQLFVSVVVSSRCRHQLSFYTKEKKNRLVVRVLFFQF